MSVELFTFDALAGHLKCSPETARSLANRLRLPRSRSNDGQTLVNIGMLIDAVEIAGVCRQHRQCTFVLSGDGGR